MIRRIKKKWRSSLTARYLVHLAAVGVFLSALLIWNASRRLNNTVLLEMEQKATILGQSLAGICTLQYYLGDLESVKYVLNQAKEFDDVGTLAVINPKGEKQIEVGTRLDTIQPLLNPERVAVKKDGSWLHVTVPLLMDQPGSEKATDLLSDSETTPKRPSSSKLLGYIFLTLSLERTHEYVRSIIFRSVAATLIIILLGSLLAFYFFRESILTPIHNLARAMTEAEKGNLEHARVDLDREDEIGRLVTAFNKMTLELAKAEEKLKKANAGLEKNVQERTKNLEEALTLLKETQEKAVRSERLAAIGQLASSVGHELRNPLGSIKNTIFYVRDSMKDFPQVFEKDPTMLELLNIADSEIKSADNIISDLLDFSRVGRLSKEPTDINELLRGMKSVLDIPKTVTLQFEQDAALPKALIDPQRIRQVFLNLAINAFHAMPKGGTLTIKTYSQTDPETSRNLFFVDFKDTGQGITPENIKKIFEPLFTTKAKGTGLGLAICAGILENHGGKILVESKIDHGSTFRVKCPIGETKA